MELLKNKEEFDAWKEAHIFSGDTAEDPEKYPCYVTKEVQSWNYEEERAVYFYRHDLENMLSRMG